MAKNNECSTCAWERGSGVEVDTSKPKARWAGIVGVSEASIRRHLKHLGSKPVPDDRPARGVNIDDDALAHLDIPVEAVTSRGASILDENGSWHKVTWDPRRKALADTLRYDDLEEALDGWEADVVFNHPTGYANILCLSDLQIGKACQRGGGTPDTIALVRSGVEAFVAQYAGGPIVIVDGGDPIENCFNTPQQLVTNDLDVPAQIRTFRRLVIEVIKVLAPLSEDVTYVAVPSNHGAHRTGYKAPGGTTDADFGLEISHQLEDVTSGHPDLEHIQYVRPDPLFETAVFEVAGTKVAVNHGHQSGGIHAHDKWWAGQDHGRMPGWDADMLIMNHYHTPSVLQSGDGRWIISTSAAEPSSDWYTNRTGSSSLRGLTSLRVKDGALLDWRVLS